MLQLIYTLTGDDNYPPVLDSQLTDYLRKLTNALEDAVWQGQLRGRRGALGLFRAYEALSADLRGSILLSPEGYEALNNLSHSASEENFDAMRRICEGALNEDTHSAGGSAEDAAEGFVIDDALTVDIGSPFCKRQDLTSPVFFGAFEPFSGEETAILHRKLSAAFSEISTLSRTFARLITSYTRKVFVRKNGTLLPASEQVDTELGGIRLRNVHLDHYSHEQLMDDLIHESVHNFLATFEFVNFPFLVHGGRYDPHTRPVSPWSMRPIRVLPFLHAAFVYFALLHFALRRLESGTLSGERRTEALTRRNRYASGFLMPGSLSSKVGGACDADVRVLQVLDYMQENVMEMFSKVPELCEV